MANKLAVLATLLDDRMRGAFDDLSQSAAAGLLTLRYRGPLTTSELAAILGVAQPTAVRLVDGLVGAGLVRRGEKVGRGAPLRLEPKGRRRADRLQAARLAAAEELLHGLDAAERDALGGLLDRLLAAGTRDRAQARTSCRLCDHERCRDRDCPIGARARNLETSGGGMGC